MKDEQHNPDTAKDGDPLVSAAYRELASERAPDNLNKAVLRRAAAAMPGYARSLSWMRPLAWAATVGLCLAIVIEITQLPQPETAAITALDDAIDLPAIAPRQQRESTRTSPPEETLQPAASAGRPSGTDLDSLQQSEAAVPTSEPAPAPSVSTEQLSESMENQRTNALQQQLNLNAPSAPSVTDEFRVKEAAMARDAEVQVRSRNGNNQESEQAFRADYAASAVAAGPEAAICDEEATATVTTWLQCISDLEKAGLADEAGRQRELLMQTFPDFEPR